MTGRRPHHTKVYDNGHSFRNGTGAVDRAGVPGARWITLPEHFKRAGYLVLGGGKVRSMAVHWRVPSTLGIVWAWLPSCCLPSPLCASVWGSDSSRLPPPVHSLVLAPPLCAQTFHPQFPPNWDQPRSWSNVSSQPYFPFYYWIGSLGPYNSTSGGPCPVRIKALFFCCAPLPFYLSQCLSLWSSSVCLQGFGRPDQPPNRTTVLSSDTWCQGGVDEPDSNFYDHGLASDTIARLQYAAGLRRSNGD